jgi:transcriptional regulator with XRE-family HTH domain
MGDVKQLRERFGLTREQFCDAFCIPYRTLQAWELGDRRCPLYVFRMVEMLLELSDRSGGLEAFKNGGNDDGK